MAERPTVLITVSGRIPNDLDHDIAAGRRPRADYRCIAERLDAAVVDEQVALDACGRVGSIVRRLGVGPLLAWYAFRNRRRYDVVLTDGEQVGIPLAALTRVLPRHRSRHVMIVHILSVPKKEWLMRLGRLASLVDDYIVYCTPQAEVVHERLGVDSARIHLTPFMVDTTFFRPAAGTPATPTDLPIVVSAGLERRDYPTMMDAVDGLDVDVVIAAASPWSKRADSSSGREIPPNVRIERLDLAALRDLYAESTMVVMPLEDVDFQAGITTILEAMAMGRPVVCSRTSGQTDTIVDGETGVYVSPADPAALRREMTALLADEERADRLGRAARRWAEDHASIERYADRLADIVLDAYRRR